MLNNFIYQLELNEPNKPVLNKNLKIRFQNTIKKLLE